MIPITEWWLVEFGGEEYIYPERGSCGPLATREEMENGRVSFAFLNREGAVMHHGAVIGSREDVRKIRRLSLGERPIPTQEAIEKVCGEGRFTDE